jgi:hypothetical protein
MYPIVNAARFLRSALLSISTLLRPGIGNTGDVNMGMCYGQDIWSERRETGRPSFGCKADVS